MTKFKVTNKILKKIPLNNLKTVLKLKNKTPENIQYTCIEDDPLFYCLLCSKIMNYSDLIDGCRCCLCDNDLFVILWNDYKKGVLHSIQSKQIFKAF